MLNIQDIVNEFTTNLETRIRESIMSTLNGTYGKATHARIPSVKNGKDGKKIKRSISKARQSQLKLTGRYMGGLRSLNKRDQAAVKAENKKKGMVSAVALAGRLKAKATKSAK